MDRYLSGPALAGLVSVDPSARPYYRALAAGVRAAILDGRLPVGARMPAERHLAQALQVSRTTVSAAYDRLREQGYIESRRGSGSRTALPDPATLGPDNPWLARGDDGMLAMHCAAPAASTLLPEAVAQAAHDLPRYTLGVGYDPLGLPALRAAVARRYTERGLATRPEQILVTSGAQSGIHLVMSLLVGQGDPVLVESPTYPHALDAARGHGARLVPVGITEDGWEPALLGEAMRQSGARLAYLIPDYHNPTGRLMDDAARAEVTAAAGRAGTTILADESWAEMGLPGSPTATPMAAFAGDDRVITVGSASKLWWGGLRVGWIRATAERVCALAHLRAAVDIAGAPFEQLVATRLFERIEQAREERRRTLCASREALVTALRARIPSWDFRVPEGGGVLWVRLDGPVATSLAATASAHGVRLAPGPWFGVEGTLEGHLRLPYTQPPQVLAEAVERIAAAHDGRPAGPPPATRTFTPAL
ncbi:PLP-dependent aminotransferase family protein [Spongiactinospora sp. TRM90649]|uniref:MocR-like transcription factor YczR n=1 Tax=Spongiactinospora sp. TRM90649 TaxID=3031114 RepID=UPI0023F9BEAB|nr:PLP-dependent aminotransferase family protein [Spongiactinospora sp. TRM90649]MDF5753758.1 PLP-dependent aminotransferase family protein [Spongiactinospora sp. TRM90649]